MFVKGVLTGLGWIIIRALEINWNHLNFVVKCSRHPRNWKQVISRYSSITKKIWCKGDYPCVCQPHRRIFSAFKLISCHFASLCFLWQCTTQTIFHIGSCSILKDTKDLEQGISKTQEPVTGISGLSARVLFKGAAPRDIKTQITQHHEIWLSFVCRPLNREQGGRPVRPGGS